MGGREHQAETVLRGRLDQLEGLLACVPIGLGLLDRNFRYVWVNSLLAEWSHVAPHDHVGRTVREMTPDLAGTIEPMLGEVLDAALPFLEREIGEPFEEEQPERRWLIRLAPWTSPAGDVQGVVLAVVANAGGRQASAPPNSVGHLGRIAYGFLGLFAHELRNSLTPILSAAQLLKRYGIRKPELVEWAGEAIERQVRQLSVMIKEVLDLSRMGRGQLELRKEPVDLNAVIAAVVQACRVPAAEKRQTLQVHVADEALWVQGDESRLGQVVQHLLQNAIKFTASGGRIELTAAVEKGDVVIRVRDTGVGFEQESLTKIFEPFFKCDEPDLAGERGLGMGLALSRGLIASHGGSLSAFSEGLGHGSEFVMTVPVLQHFPNGNGERDGPRAAASAPQESREE